MNPATKPLPAISEPNTPKAEVERALDLAKTDGRMEHYEQLRKNFGLTDAMA